MCVLACAGSAYYTLHERRQLINWHGNVDTYTTRGKVMKRGKIKLNLREFMNK